MTTKHAVADPTPLDEELTLLPTRVRKCLEKAGIRTVGDLIWRTPYDLMMIQNFGRKYLTEVEKFLGKRRFRLRRDETYPFSL